MRFNPPPNWPPPPPGFTPDPMTFTPDPAWGPPPPGWPLFVPSSGPKKSLLAIGGVVVIALAIALPIALSGGGGASYPANIQANFLNSCESTGGDTTNCQCALSYLEKHVSLTQLKADEADILAGSVPADLQNAIQAC